MLPNEEIANEVYDVLVICGGALPDNRDNFVHAHIVEDYPCEEYRFQGHFGFGGKFRSHGAEVGPWEISYHSDDVRSNPDLYYSLMVAINTVLFEIWDKWKKVGEK